MELHGGILMSCVFLLLNIQFAVFVHGNQVARIAKSLDVNVNVIHNQILDPQSTISIPGKIRIVLNPKETIPKGWDIYLCMDAELSQGQHIFQVTPVNGCIMKLTNKIPIPANTNTNDTFIFSRPIVSKYDFIQGWFLSDGTFKALIEKTTNGDRSYIQPFVGAEQTLRVIPADMMFFPHTFNKRYIEPAKSVNDKSKSQFSVIPMPLQQTTPSTDAVNPLLLGASWVIKTDPSLMSLAKYLKSAIGNPKASSTGDINLKLNSSLAEYYKVSINRQTNRPKIDIVAGTQAGIFYGFQTLLSLRQDDGSIPQTTITDKPYYPYRGIMVDLSFNFFGVSTLKKLLDVMAQYKLNKLKIGLSGDNAWRIEVPGYPTLTAADISKCRDFTRKTCAFNPYSVISDTSPSTPRFFTAKDYKLLIREAKKRFIQIIPSIDLDSTIAARASLYNVKKTVPPAKFSSVHECYRYKYLFFENVLKALVKYHKEAGQPLEVVNVGGENPHILEEWNNTGECIKYIRENVLPANKTKEQEDLLQQHVNTLYSIADGFKVKLSASGNFFFVNPTKMIQVSTPNKLYAVTQENTGVPNLAGRPQVLANAGFKVIQSAKDYLNLDHSTEPGPREPGDNYATRYIDARRIYNYLPRNPCCNFMPDLFMWGYLGDPPSGPSGCVARNHEYCKLPDQKQNFEGIEAKVLTRKIHNEGEFFKALFPGIIVLADKAWHVAKWEAFFKPPVDNTSTALQAAKLTSSMGVQHRDKHWAELKNVIGNKELKRLGKIGVKYNIPLPGIRLGNAITQGKAKIFPIYTSMLYPGHLIPQMQDITGRWIDIPANTKIKWESPNATAILTSNGQEQTYQLSFFFRTRTADNTGYSRSERITNYEFFQPGTYDFDRHAQQETMDALNKYKSEIDEAKRNHIAMLLQQNMFQQQQISNQLNYLRQQYIPLLQQHNGVLLELQRLQQAQRQTPQVQQQLQLQLQQIVSQMQPIQGHMDVLQRQLTVVRLQAQQIQAQQIQLQSQTQVPGQAQTQVQ